MKNYYRVMLGKGSVHISDCLAESYIGADFGIHQDLTGKVPDEWRVFNRQFIPIFLAGNPEKTKVVAGLACGNLWNVAKGINRGDLVLCPDGEGHFHVGEVNGDYTYRPGGILPHRRSVQWFSQSINRTDLSDALRRSAGAASTVINLTGYSDEIEHLLARVSAPTLISTDETVEDPSAFRDGKASGRFSDQKLGVHRAGKRNILYIKKMANR
jgi:restriction system protein